jgi:hypothetical protein
MLKRITGSLLALLLALPGVSAAQDPAEEYEQLLRTNEGLEAYNALLERQIAAQEVTRAELQEAIGRVPDLERQIPPLIERMVEGLRQFVELDIPFLLDERTDRLERLEALAESGNVDDAEKFRRVLEAWEIENNYGRDVSAYSTLLDVGGVNQTVDVLRVGRVGLFYQTQDLDSQGAWDPRSNQWVVLGSEHRNSIRQALRMALNQVAPEQVLLPITPPTTD